MQLFALRSKLSDDITGAPCPITEGWDDQDGCAHRNLASGRLDTNSSRITFHILDVALSYVLQTIWCRRHRCQVSLFFWHHRLCSVSLALSRCHHNYFQCIWLIFQQHAGRTKSRIILFHWVQNHFVDTMYRSSTMYRRKRHLVEYNIWSTRTFGWIFVKLMSKTLYSICKFHVLIC